MQLSLAALVAILPAMGWACASYGFCLCQQADGSFNDAATKQACRSKNGNYLQFDDGRHYCGAGVASAGIAGAQPLLLSNCNFRQTCQNFGATGDSNCWAKQ
ncbi:hypothetical protein CPLU01_10393 [Colletotrichum plurivorum]|uniref:Uncharacterized protein n=1 Tax=Colletotrichum plurivorum TaxID=2175906 RepID=A0A8H6K585_9PEZI|nr:hypothetical protein CPLU01_10393 [Colletotrichum plurivorum]